VVQKTAENLDRFAHETYRRLAANEARMVVIGHGRAETICSQEAWRKVSSSKRSAKMDRKQVSVILATGAVFVSMAFLAQAHGNESGLARAAIGKATVSIEFRRPSLKGRDLMKMIHPGDLWRLGADAPTTIESNADLDFGGTRVPKGKHVLLARYIEPGKWTLVVSSKDRMHYEPSAKLAEIPLEVQEGKDPVEELKIDLSSVGENGVVEIAWGAYRLKGSFRPAK